MIPNALDFMQKPRFHSIKALKNKRVPIYPIDFLLQCQNEYRNNGVQ